MQVELKDVLLKFAQYDAEQKRLKKISEPLKKQIKDYMSENDIEKLEEGPVVAQFQRQERVSTNEEKLVDKLKSLGFDKAIRTVEVPDQEVIEELIYQGELNPAELDDCVIRKEIERLTVKGGDKL